MYVTKRTKFHWKDLKRVIKFVDNLTEIAQRMNAGFWMGLIRPMVHTLNKTSCVHKTLVKSLIFMLMFINYIYLQRYVTTGFYSTFQQKLLAAAIPELISWRDRIILVPNNKSKVIARYCISRRNGTIQINKFSLLVAMHPYWKIGDTSTHALPRHRRALPFH